MKLKEKCVQKIIYDYPLPVHFHSIEHHYVFESKLNYMELKESDIKKFIFPSSEKYEISEHPSEFSKAIREELRYMGMDYEDFAKSLNIPPYHMRLGLYGRKKIYRKFLPHEVEAIKKRLRID